MKKLETRYGASLCKQKGRCMSKDKKSLRDVAVLNVDKGDEIAGMWITPPIKEVGRYKLLAVKRKDGTCEWAHFIQRDNGDKDRVLRGKLDTPEQLQTVCEVINRNLQKIYSAEILLEPADFDMFTVDGQKASRTVH